MKWPDLDKQLTTTRITIQPWDLGKLVMKSMAMSSQICFGIGRG